MENRYILYLIGTVIVAILFAGSFLTPKEDKTEKEKKV
jgi:hypothetical protein